MLHACRIVYRTSGKFGGDLNLAVCATTAKLKSANISVLTLYAYIRKTIPYLSAKFKFANTFISAALDQTAKFKDHQYFRLYGRFEDLRLPKASVGVANKLTAVVADDSSLSASG